MHAHPLSLLLPSPVKLQCTLQLTLFHLYQYMYSVVTLIKLINKIVRVGDTKLCAGNGQVDTCNGDSGGALLSDVIGVSECTT
jgi:hypothetical protein